MLRIQVILVGLAIVTSLFLLPNIAVSDVLKPGYKNIKHELVFADTPFISDNQLVAAPIAGFHGIEKIEPEKPFRFSSKYGTRIYLIPAGDSIPTEFDRDAFAKYLSWDMPLSETRSLPASSPIASILTTLRFVGTGVADAKLEVADQEQYDRSGNIAKPGNMMLWFSLAVAAGLGICLLAIRRMRKIQRQQLATASADSAVTSSAEV